MGTHDRLLTISEYKIIEMGCNQSSENQWAYANENAPIKNVSKDIFLMKQNTKISYNSICV